MGPDPLTAAAESLGEAVPVRGGGAGPAGGGRAGAPRDVGLAGRAREAMRLDAPPTPTTSNVGKTSAARVANDLYSAGVGSALSLSLSSLEGQLSLSLALAVACQTGHVEAARLLLEKGAAVDANERHDGAHVRLR